MKSPTIKRNNLIQKLRLLEKEINRKLCYIKITNEKLYVQTSELLVNKYPNILCKPHWFKAHVYYDIITHQDLIVLQYGNIDKNNSPIVRIQSESILDRFPLKVKINKTKYKK